MVDSRLLAAFELVPEATARQIAERFWALSGLPGGPTNDLLWGRLLQGIESLLAHPVAPGPRGAGGDAAELANFVAEYAIVAPGRPDEATWGGAAWDEELGLSGGESNEWMREFVYDQIAPRLGRAGLYYLH